jgi:hypothetical protein
LFKVRETLSRRFQTTQIWYRWKQYCGNEEQFRNGTISSENRTRLDLNMPNSSPSVNIIQNTTE